MLIDEIHAVESYKALVARAAHDDLMDVEVRALIDMAYPLSWTSSERSLEALERALQFSVHQEDPTLRARTQAERFLKIALATAEHTWQALAWEVAARLAVAELDRARALHCVAQGSAEEPLREKFLSAPMIRKILGDRETQ